MEKTNPLDKFNQFVSNNRDWIKRSFEPLYGDFVVRQEIGKMRTWITTAPPKKANKRKWDRFMVNWFSHCEAEKERVIVNMNARQEQLYYDTKQRPVGRRGDFERMEE